MQTQTTNKITETEIDPDAPVGPIKDYNSFDSAIGYCRLNGITEIEVDPKFFEKRFKGVKENSITFGNPAVRVFKAGTKDVQLKREKLNAEAYDALVIKERQEKGENA